MDGIVWRLLRRAAMSAGNDCNGISGVRPFCIKQADGVGNKLKPDKDTKNRMTIHKRVNTKECLIWIVKVSYVILTTYIRHIGVLNLAKLITEVVRDLRA